MEHHAPPVPRTAMPNLEHRLDREGDSLELPSAVTIMEHSLHQWGWRDPAGNASTRYGYGGKVIIVKWGNVIKKVGIDGTAEAIKEAIKSCFGLCSKRTFWLEDDDGVIRSFDRKMPAGIYTLHLDEGVTIKICSHEDDNGQILQSSEEKTFYTEDGFREFLRRRQWSGLREICSFRDVNTFGELQPSGLYQRI